MLVVEFGVAGGVEVLGELLEVGGLELFEAVDEGELTLLALLYLVLALVDVEL